MLLSDGGVLNSMKCVICGVSVDFREDMTSLDGWAPFFFEGDEPHGPICPDCCDGLLKENPDGDLVLRDEYRGKISYLYELDEEDEEDYEIEEVMLGYILN
jgi:hypothetical protein